MSNSTEYHARTKHVNIHYDSLHRKGLFRLRLYMKVATDELTKPLKTLRFVPTHLGQGERYQGKSRSVLEWPLGGRA